MFSLLTRFLPAKYFLPFILLLIIGGLGWYGYSTLQNQKSQIDVLKGYVSEVKEQNDQLKQANVAITKDMKAIKEGLTLYSKNLQSIKSQTTRLNDQINSKEYRELLKSDVPKAQVEFNKAFNEYMEGFNSDTKSYEK